MLALDNGLNVQPLYLCSQTANCKNPSCRLDMEDFCKHTTDKFYAKNPESVKLFDEFFNRFKPTICFAADNTTIIFEEIETEGKRK